MRPNIVTKAGIPSRVGQWWEGIPFLTSAVVIVCGIIYFICRGRILPVAVTNRGNQSSRRVQIGAGLSQVYSWLTCTVHVFLNYFNLSPVHRHNRPQVVPDHQASSHQHQINILNSTVHVFYNVSPVHRHNGPQVVPHHQASSQHHQFNVLNPISHDSNHVREASNNHMNPITLLFQSKIVFSLIVPITELLLNDYKSLTVFQSSFIIIVLSFAFAATFSGMFLEGSIASVTVNLGTVLAFISYYGLISSKLPAALGWICWLCFALSCAPLVRSIRRLIFSSTSTDITQRRSPV